MKIIQSIFLLFCSLSILAQVESESIFKIQSIPEDMQGSRGVAWGDLNHDGWPEIIVANQGPEEMPSANHIYRNKSGQSFEMADLLFKGEHWWSEGVYLIDVDNDHDLDVFFTTQFDNPNPLYLNIDGSLVPGDVGDLTKDETNSQGACWCDYDLDGDLDAFVLNKNGVDDILYINNGLGKFNRSKTGPWIGNGGDGRACAWGDLNNDNYPDLVVVSYGIRENGEVVGKHRNYLYLSSGKGTYQENTEGHLVTEKSASYGVSLIDFDYDLDLDIFVTNISRSDVNYLYKNDGNGNFTEPVENALSYYTNRPSKGQTWGDFNNDGFLDVYIANGTENFPEIQNYLFLQSSDHSFKRIYSEVSVTDANISAGVSSGDFNNDGRLDLFVCNWGGDAENNVLYTNVNTKGNWIKIKLTGSKSNSFGIGSWVIVKTTTGNGERLLTRYHSASNGYGSQNEPIIHFGLGNVTEIDYLEVKWPNGHVLRLQGIEPNKSYNITEDKGMVKEL